MTPLFSCVMLNHHHHAPPPQPPPPPPQPPPHKQTDKIAQILTLLLSPQQLNADGREILPLNLERLSVFVEAFKLFLIDDCAEDCDLPLAEIAFSDIALKQGLSGTIENSGLSVMYDQSGKTNFTLKCDYYNRSVLLFLLFPIFVAVISYFCCCCFLFLLLLFPTVVVVIVVVVVVSYCCCFLLLLLLLLFYTASVPSCSLSLSLFPPRSNLSLWEPFLEPWKCEVSWKNSLSVLGSMKTLLAPCYSDWNVKVDGTDK